MPSSVSSDREKAPPSPPVHVDNIDDDPLPDPGTPERAEAEKRLVRILDFRVLPTVIVIYIMNYIDRVAVTTARLQGLEADLGLTDIQYNIILSIVYASYSPVQIPSNMLLNYLTRPSWYIGLCVITWGLISTLTGVTTSFEGLAAARFFLGIPESAFYPGTIYLLSRWYTKKELAFRSAILYAGLLISNAFGALMAAGILSGMEGMRGIRAWRWLFFIEGAITIVIGILSIWLLPDYPHNTGWISKKDRRLAQARVAEDAGEADKDNKEDSPWKGLVMAVKDPKVWIMAFMNITQLLGLSFVNFFPTLTGTLGFNTTITLLLAAPPWILATIVCCLNAWHADRTGERFFHIAGWWWGVILGFIIGLSTMNTGARYVSMFLMACGYAGFSITLVWTSNILPRPPAKRAAAIGVVNGIGNLGNLIGSFTWRASWSPEYHPSMGVSLAALVLSSSAALFLRQLLVRENRKMAADEQSALEGANRARVEEAARLEGITLDQALEKRKGFQYLY